MEFRDEQTHAHFVLDVDSARLQGSRSAFGAALQLGVSTPYEQPSKDVPLLFYGSLAWANQTDGLQIPAQSIRGGTSALAVPISDVQIAAIESVRKAAEPCFSLRLRMIAQNEKGEVRHYGGLGGQDSYNYVVPRDRWHDALDLCGHGRIRIVELPPPPEPASADWNAAAEALVASAAELRSGYYGAASTSSRKALEHVVAAIEIRLAIAPKKQWPQRVKAAEDALRELHKSHHVAAYALYAELLRTLFNFASGGAHSQGATRDDAEFALTLATGLYAHLARVPIPTALLPEGGEAAADTPI
ncbi:MAG: hypothetical protein M3169_07395 [Candidatus Eremiobacteraeota bacterium]|nr:hypothetical protein [Candidatus Eremiobacteraeota bacterium]